MGKKVGLEDKFIARIPDVEIVIVPDNQCVVNRKSPIKLLFKHAFTPRKLLQKYKTANMTLDIIHLSVMRHLKRTDIRKLRVHSQRLLNGVAQFSV